MPIDPAYLFDDTKVASYLKSARSHHDLTLEQLSRLTKEIDPAGAGVSRVALSRYENGASLPGLRELRLISFATRRPLALLFYGERTDPMSSYRLELEMRITDVVMGQVDAQGLIKEVAEQDPEDENFKSLVESVKASS